MDPSQRNVWFITGCSKGFGLCLVKALLASEQQKFHVTATTRTPETLLKELNEAHLDVNRVLALNVDLMNEDSIRDALNKTVEKFGKIDVIVNNAGFGLTGCLEEAKTEDFHKLFDINVFAVHKVIRNVLPIMRKQNHGLILNIASIGAQCPRGGNGIYAATKAAVVAMTESLADEGSDFNIKACAICPGPYRTNFQSNLQTVQPQVEAYSRIHETLNNFMSMRFPGDPENGAKTIIKVAFLENIPTVFFLGEMSCTNAKKKFTALSSQVTEFEKLSLEG